MALNVSYAQYYQGLDVQSLKSTTKNILANSIAKSSSTPANDVYVDLYNGQIDTLTARQVAMSGSGLQVTLNNNLETAIKFLKTKAAEVNRKSSTAEVVSIDSAKKDKNGSNPFYNGELLDSKKREESKKNEKVEYLFIKVA